MRSYLALTILLLGFGLSSCRCADPPPIGPVEEADTPRTDTVDQR